MERCVPRCEVVEAELAEQRKRPVDRLVKSTVLDPREQPRLLDPPVLVAWKQFQKLGLDLREPGSAGPQPCLGLDELFGQVEPPSYTRSRKSLIAGSMSISFQGNGARFFAIVAPGQTSLCRLT
jgi:hypothetical protein